VDDLVDFIANAGGVEEIRLAKSPNALTTQQRIERAKSALPSDCLALLKSDAITKELDMAQVGNQVVLIAEQLADGELAIKCLVKTTAAINAALSGYYGSVSKTLKEQQSTDAVSSNAQAIQDAVAAAPAAANETALAA
jgi:hypothetical protein